MGKLIVFEGIDGSGKSTQFKMMCTRLANEGKQFKRLVFPRYNEPSSALIKMYLAGDFGSNPDSVNAYAASSFYAVDRYASFITDWRDYYNNGGLILTDRYTTSNALHQGAKVESSQRKEFFEWLYDYEFNLLGLPVPDFVIYMNIELKYAEKRLRKRQQETNTDPDIHEKDMKYLETCAKSGEQAATQLNWYKIDCISNEHERNADDIHEEIYNLII